MTEETGIERHWREEAEAEQQRIADMYRNLYGPLLNAQFNFKVNSIQGLTGNLRGIGGLLSPDWWK